MVKKGWLTGMLGGHRPAADLQARLRDEVGAGLRLDEVLRSKPGSHVYSARWDGRAVIVKQFGEDAAGIPDRAAAEFARVGAAMGDGPFRVVELLHAGAGSNCIVMSQAPGRSMQAALDATGGAARAALLARCGAWLAAYMAGGAEAGQFGPGHWIERRRNGRLVAGLGAADDLIAKALMEDLRRRATHLRGAPVTRGPVHGDFTPMNLHLDAAGTIWGFDIQGRSAMPVARDLARFIVTWLRSSDVGSGFPWSETEALAGGLLSDRERGTILPFFLAEQLAGRWCVERIDRVRKARLRGAIDDFLETGR